VELSVNPNNQERRHWHVDKTVNVTHMLTTIAGIATAAIFLAKQDTRIALLESSVAQQQTIDRRQDQERMEFKAEVKDLLRDIRESQKEIREDIKIIRNGKK
jgi:protein subunit release factor B